MRAQSALPLLLLAAGCLGHSIEKREIFFQDVVRQRSLGNNGITQCPCVIHPESRQCIAYDSRYQAATIEEAILTFPDLTHDSFYPAPVSSATFLCQSAECQQCFGLLYYRLLEIGFLSSSYRPHLPVLPRNQLNPSNCPRLKFPVPPIIPPEPPKPEYVRQLMAAGYRFMQSGGLRAPPRQSSNRDRFRPGPRQGDGAGAGDRPPGSNRNQQQNQHSQPPHHHIPGSPQRPQQGQRPQQPQQPQQPQITRPQNPGRQLVDNVWNAAARRWEQRPRGQGSQPFPPLTPPRNQNGQQGHGWPQPPRQWPQQAPSQWQHQVPQVQQQVPQQQQQFPQFQQPQLPQQFQPIQQQLQPIQQQQVQQLQPQLPQVQQPQQQLQWQTQVQGQPQWQQPQVQEPQWPQTQWQQQQQPGQFLQPDVQQSLVHQALAQTHQAINPLTQQASFPFQGSQGGTNGQGGQGGQGGVAVGGSVQTPVVGNLLGGLFGRKKRAVSDDPLVGRRFTIACIRRGETSSEDGEFLSLCGTCWTWRELPEDYFPRILNELSCQENDYCLSGWGACKQQLRNVDVLRRVDGRWIPQSVTTATCCDCRVKAGTEIHALVLGDRRKTE